MLKKIIRKVFHLREDVGIHFYIANAFFKYILRQNADTPWAVHHSSTIHFPERIKRGDQVFPGDSPGNFIDAANGIEIGDFTNIGPNVGIISTNHDLIDNRIFTVNQPIRIGAHCWIGMGVVILPGTELGDHTVVGANSVVTGSFAEGYCVVAGNPAKIVKHLDKEACRNHAYLRRESLRNNK
ncbi:MAG TPA: acyltransferase [Puia sp.]|nr:acyltransferase [Puia sp.]